VKDKRTSTSAPIPPVAIIFVYQPLFWEVRGEVYLASVEKFPVSVSVFYSLQPVAAELI
jgi:hypothetical protein